MTTDPRLLETLERLATKGIPDTMPISLCPEGAALDRIKHLDDENERMRALLTRLRDHCGTFTNSEISDLCRDALTAGKLGT